MTEEERAIICAALAFAAADREDDEAQIAYDDNPTEDNRRASAYADGARWRALETLLTAVRRCEEARRG